MTVRAVDLPAAPPADTGWQAEPKPAPNWALKTAMAATGTLLGAIITFRLIGNLFLYVSRDHFDYIIWRSVAFLVPYLPAGGWVWIVRGVACLLLLTHLVLAVILLRRAKAGRGRWRARLFGGLSAWLTRLMPYSGAVVGLSIVVYGVSQADRLGQLCEPAASPTSSMLSCDVLIPSLEVPWMSALFMIGILALSLHMLHGLATVATIAAGRSQLAGRIKEAVLLIGAVILGAILMANWMIPIGLQWGWLS